MATYKTERIPDGGYNVISNTDGTPLNKQPLSKEAAERIISLMNEPIKPAKAETKILKVEKTFKTLDEMYESAEFMAIYSGYENNIPMAKRVNAKLDFHAAYTVYEPAYGVDYAVYMQYTADGVQFLNRVALGSCLDCRPFHEFGITDEGDIEIIRRDWDKSESNRRIIRDRGVPVTTIW
jgi:hypothetical protein